MTVFRATAYSVSLIVEAADLPDVDAAVNANQIPWRGAFGCWTPGGEGRIVGMVIEFPRTSIPALLCALPEPLAAKVAAQLDCPRA